MPNILKKIHIELTNRCNLHCIMCYRNSMKSPIGDMDFELLKKIVNQIRLIQSVEEVFIHWRGEPLCYNNFVSAITYMSDLCAKKIVFTNGLLLSITNIELLIRNNIDELYFSVEAIDNINYSAIRGCNLLEQVEHNIIETINIRNKCCSKTKIKISYVLLESNIDKVFDFFSKWEKIVDEIIIKQDSRTIVRDINTRCVWPYNGLFISYQGIVSACCMDVNHEYIIGDININTLEEIFNSQRINLLRDCISHNIAIGKCRTCQLF